MPDFFSPHFFSLKAKPKILLGGAKPFIMVLPPLVGLFLKNGRCSKLLACRLISNDTLYFIYKFALRRLVDNIDHFQSFKKAGRTPDSFRAEISSISLRTVGRPDFSDTLSLTLSNSVILRTWSSKHT
jgi:hypothetical protein